VSDSPRHRKILATATDVELAAASWLWEFEARADQLAPAGDWAVWLILAGRGWGKTRSGAGYIIQRAERNPKARIALVGRTAADVRDVMLEGESGIMAKSPPWFRPVYEPSKRRLTWPNGAMATTYSSDKPDQLRGPQHTDAWADELAAWRYPDAWDQLQFGLRLGSAPRAIVTTTPRPTPIVRELLNDRSTAITRGRTLDNKQNLSERFIARMLSRYEGTRLGRQELDGEVLDDNPGALWRRSDIDAARVTAVPDLVRVVVGVDPAVSANEGSAETGIIVAGLGRDGHAYVLADCSLSETPEKWARAVCAAYSVHRADLIVGEVNNGGDLVEANIRTVDRSVPFRAVRASRGKAVRAEPISALYEQGRVHHVGVLAELEDQLTDWDPAAGGASPDRLDALVWALTELDVANANAGPAPRTTTRTAYRMGSARGF